MKVKYKVLFVTIKTKFVQFPVVLLAGCRTELEVRHFMSCQLSWSFHMYIRRGRRRCLGSTIVVSENHIYMFFRLSFEKSLGVNCSYERNCFHECIDVSQNCSPSKLKSSLGTFISYVDRRLYHVSDMFIRGRPRRNSRRQKLYIIIYSSWNLSVTIWF